MLQVVPFAYSDEISHRFNANTAWNSNRNPPVAPTGHEQPPTFQPWLSAVECNLSFSLAKDA
ncbi:hypothetical protein A1359_18520 [Methylomonas lenta]|uniref:Uncharacterized protein n=1 Tax=Methylomonas lenta TaxID=980561 RepID=A0A177MVC6_9GAMM|nr:hypothetical protein [Methylomonas lenta]OAI09677.1 hypothetical protein A1359_18520 [Methylomonas lenta]